MKPLPTISTCKTSYTLVFDLGASQPTQGHLRVGVYQPDGQLLDRWEGQASEKPFETSRDLITGIQNALTQVWKKSTALANGPLTRIIGLVPSRTLGNHVTLFSNLMTPAGQRLANVDFNGLKGLTKSPADLLVTIDTMAGLADVAHQLQAADSQRFQPGYHGLYLATGGGIAVGELLKTGPAEVLLKVSERKPHDSTSRFSLAEPEVAPNPMGHVLAALSDNPEAKQFPLKTLVDYSTAKTYLPVLTRPEWETRAKEAIHRYADVLAHLISLKVFEGLTEVILSGPFHQGLKAYLQENPALFGQELKDLQAHRPELASRPVLEQLLWGRVLTRLDVMGRQLMDGNRFAIRSDLRVHDNTYGGWLLSKGYPVNPETRSNWFRLYL